MTFCLEKLKLKSIKKDDKKEHLPLSFNASYMTIINFALPLVTMMLDILFSGPPFKHFLLFRFAEAMFATLSYIFFSGGLILQILAS